MRFDLKRHKLLKILASKTAMFHADELPSNSPMGTSFEVILSKMKCNRQQLEIISSELYQNKEIGYYDESEFQGLYCEHNGLTAYSNAKYKSRFWRDFWSNLFTISQIIVPIMALAVALITVLDSRQSREHTEEILLLKKELNRQQELLDTQTKAILNFEKTYKGDSLSKN